MKEEDTRDFVTFKQVSNTMFNNLVLVVYVLLLFP